MSSRWSPALRRRETRPAWIRPPPPPSLRQRPRPAGECPRPRSLRTAARTSNLNTARSRSAQRGKLRGCLATNLRSGRTSGPPPRQRRTRSPAPPPPRPPGDRGRGLPGHPRWLPCGSSHRGHLRIRNNIVKYKYICLVVTYISRRGRARRPGRTRGRS